MRLASVVSRLEATSASSPWYPPPPQPRPLAPLQVHSLPQQNPPSPPWPLVLRFLSTQSPAPSAGLPLARSSSLLSSLLPPARSTRPATTRRRDLHHLHTNPIPATHNISHAQPHALQLRTAHGGLGGDGEGQYPGEKEITFPPFTCLESDGDPRVERNDKGEIVVFPLKVHSPPPPPHPPAALTPLTTTKSCHNERDPMPRLHDCVSGCFFPGRIS